MEFKTHISVKNFSVWYGNHLALNNISIDIPDKKITVIIGPSGCGKTTLLKSFNRMIDLYDGIKVFGQVFVDGEDIYETTEVTHLRRKMGLLFQRPQVLPMSIYDNVAYGLRIHGLKDKNKLDGIVEHYLKESSLWDEVKDRLHSPASKLSTGQQQRLCLARGLAVEPEVILGDEPTSALDPISAERIERRFLELKQNYTIVLVTHILRQAKKLADYVIFLYLGNLIEHGPAEEFFNKPKYAKTKAYINGLFIEEFKEVQELHFKGTDSSTSFAEVKLTLGKMNIGQILKLIVENETAVKELPPVIEFEGHKVLEVKHSDHTKWEIYVQKQDISYTI